MWVADEKTGMIDSRYWNCNGTQVSISAFKGAINYVGAYIGATYGATKEHETHDWTRRFGSKLSEEDAYRMLPNLKEKMKELGLHYRR